MGWYGIRGAAGGGARGRWLTGCAAALALFGIAVAGAANELPPVDAAPPWALAEREEHPENGYAIYKRKPIGSEYFAYRLEAEIDASPERVAEAAAEVLADPEASQSNMEKTILRNDGEAIVVYSYIHISAPFVADRDVTTRATRSFDPETRTHRLDWSATDEGPAPREGVVRLEKSQGSWSFAPAAPGRTRVVYESHTEIAGSMPAWLVNVLMNDTILQGLVNLRERVRREPTG